MTRRVGQLELLGCEPAHELALVAGLLERAPDEGAALVLASLSGEAIASGRHQPEPERARAHALRRLTGGRATRYGAGILSLCAVLPTPEAWLSDAAPLSGPRLLNRYVRGLLDAFARLGLAASYPGRDFVRIDAGQVAYLSFERPPNGAFLFQAIVALGRPFSSDPPLQFPGLPDPPQTTSLAAAAPGRADERSVRAALVEAFAARFSLALEPLARERHLAVSPQRAPAAVLPDPLAEDFVALPIGRLAASVSLRADGTLAGVRFAGDWIASSLDVATLESALVGAAPEADATRLLVERWLRIPSCLVVGVGEPGPIVEALRRASRRAARAE